MLLPLKERFRQSIVVTILFIKVKTHIHTMIIYITCKKIIDVHFTVPTYIYHLFTALSQKRHAFVH